MNPSTYDSYLLFTNSNKFGVVAFEIDGTLILTDKKFAIAEEIILKEAKFKAKKKRN